MSSFEGVDRHGSYRAFPVQNLHLEGNMNTLTNDTSLWSISPESGPVPVTGLDTEVNVLP